MINPFPKILRHVWLLLVFCVASAFGADAPRAIIIAHRGASGYLPEHTLPGKALAYAMGADYLEQDIVLSKDGVPVVVHDIQVDTVTDVARRFPDRQRKDGRFYAIDFTLGELKQLKVTERFNPKTGKAVYARRFPVGQSAFEISTLEEELQFIQGLNKSAGRNVGIYPELKQPDWHRQQGQDISKIVLPILARYGYRTKADNFYLQCFDFDELKRLRAELGFEGKLILLLEKKTERVRLEEIAKVADGIGPSLDGIVAGKTDGVVRFTDLVNNAHELKLAVHPYTFRADDLPRYASSLEELFEIFILRAGVNGVFTDFPDRGANFVRSHSAQK